VDERERLSVLRTNGIATMVTFRGKPGELRQEEVEQLKITQNDPETLERLSDQRPDLGAKVKVTDGPMAGLTGHVLEHRAEMQLVVQIEAIKQSVKITLSNAAIEEI
jgi:transcription antitermination factor NusG